VKLILSITNLNLKPNPYSNFGCGGSSLWPAINGELYRHHNVTYVAAIACKSSDLELEEEEGLFAI